MMVAISTFEWASFRIINKMPRHDIITGILVALITIVLHNLALAVLIGVIISALVFAWESAKRIRITLSIAGDGTKYYTITGPLFFGSAMAFAEEFDIANDPEKVIIDFKESRITDMSAIDTISNLTKKYAAAGKTLQLKHLSHDSLILLKNAGGVIDVNIIEGS